MRVEICYENAWQYNWFIVEGGLEFADEVPLTWGYDWQRGPIGKVADIRREKDGAITGEVSFYKSEYKVDVELLLKNNDAEVSMYANKITDERVAEDLRIAYKATLRAVVIILNPAFPKIPEGITHG